MTNKTHPFGVGNTVAQRGQFASLCHDLVEALLATTPFNRTRLRPEWLTVIKAFAPSAQSGPRLGAAAGHATVLGSSVDSATNRLVVDHARLATLLASQVITTTRGTQTLAELYAPGGIVLGVTGGLVAVITPSIAKPDEYHLVATTATGLWHQVVLRCIGTALGLADEYDRAGAAFAAASERSTGLASTPNLVFAETSPVMNADVSDWLHVMSPVEALPQAVVHAHPPNDLSNTTIPAAPVAEGRIGFFEGAGGFRRKAYRAAEIA